MERQIDLQIEEMDVIEAPLLTDTEWGILAALAFAAGVGAVVIVAT